MMATCWPDGSTAGTSSCRWPPAQSATKRSRWPIATGAPLRPRTHSASHWCSCGHTRPVTAGRALSPNSVRAAAARSPCSMWATNVGMSTVTGQPSTHVARLHARQRWASRSARCSVNPRLTSSKVADRCPGSRVGISCRSMAMRSRLESGWPLAPSVVPAVIRAPGTRGQRPSSPPHRTCRAGPTTHRSRRHGRRTRDHRHTRSASSRRW